MRLFFHFFRRKVEKQKICLKNPDFWGRKKGGLGLRVNARRFYDQTSTFSLKDGLDRGCPCFLRALTREKTQKNRAND